MAVSTKQVLTISVISAKGRFEGGIETDELEKAIADAIAAGNTRLVINLKDCDYLSSTPIGVLARALANYKTRNGEIKLCGLGKRVKDIFVMTKLIMMFDHHETEDQALAAFAAS